MNKVKHIYDIMLDAYGRQGWWPIQSLAKTQGFDKQGYAKESYIHPEKPEHIFEIILGAILTQNTAWTNVEKALAELHHLGWMHPSTISKLPHAKLASTIRSTGYFNQKAKRLKLISSYFLDDFKNSFSGWHTQDIELLRTELLSMHGIGPETADSILLYAFKRPSFVVDAYTKRIFSRIGMIHKDMTYDKIKCIFEDALPLDVPIFNEYHALIVEHAKRNCKTKPICEGCVLGKICEKRI
ncbi:MAG: hypothetical protein AABX52_01000 [Nanoarchaeota archaeon]